MRTTPPVDSELAERTEREPEKSSGRISYTHPVSLGGCLLESLADIAAVLAAAEGESFK